MLKTKICSIALALAFALSGVALPGDPPKTATSHEVKQALSALSSIDGGIRLSDSCKEAVFKAHQIIKSIDDTNGLTVWQTVLSRATIHKSLLDAFTRVTDNGNPLLTKMQKTILPTLKREMDEMTKYAERETDPEIKKAARHAAELCKKGYEKNREHTARLKTNMQHINDARARLQKKLKLVDIYNRVAIRANTLADKLDELNNSLEDVYRALMGKSKTATLSNVVTKRLSVSPNDSSDAAKVAAMCISTVKKSGETSVPSWVGLTDYFAGKKAE